MLERFPPNSFMKQADGEDGVVDRDFWVVLSAAERRMRLQQARSYAMQAECLLQSLGKRKIPGRFFTPYTANPAPPNQISLPNYHPDTLNHPPPLPKSTLPLSFAANETHICPLVASSQSGTRRHQEPPGSSAPPSATHPEPEIPPNRVEPQAEAWQGCSLVCVLVLARL